MLHNLSFATNYRVLVKALKQRIKYFLPSFPPYRVSKQNRELGQTRHLEQTGRVWLCVRSVCIKAGGRRRERGRAGMVAHQNR